MFIAFSAECKLSASFLECTQCQMLSDLAVFTSNRECAKHCVWCGCGISSAHRSAQRSHLLVRHFDRVRERDAARQRDEPVDSALIRCKSRQRTGSRCYPRSGGKLMATARSAARTASSEGALRADRSAVRPLSAQCALRTAAVQCAVRSFSVRTALDFTALRSIFTPHCARFHRSAFVSPRSAQAQCGRFRPHRCRAVRLAQ